MTTPASSTEAQISPVAPHFSSARLSDRRDLRDLRGLPPWPPPFPEVRELRDPPDFAAMRTQST
ncbi:MAG: hypothetical protein ACTSXZ_05330, partial [Alphaproteobacteria bacterium]